MDKINVHRKSNKKYKRKKKGRFTDLKPIDFGPGSEKSSTQIDEVLYG